MASLQHLSIVNFRSHAIRSIDLAPRTVIVGSNGIGKTNILEALWLLATTRSFRTARIEQVVRWDTDATQLQLDDWELIVARAPQLAKAFKIRGVPKRPIEYLGTLRAVLFTPDSYRLLVDGPPERRRFLDTLSAQSDRGLARLLVSYRQILKQRNTQLRQIRFHGAAVEDLTIWDDQLITTALQITAARRQLFDTLTPHVKAYHTALGRSREVKLALTYQPSSPVTADQFREKIESVRDRELATQVTLIGPHRDTFSILLNGRPAEIHASRGELRRILLALKWAEVKLLRAADVPLLLLLDDVFSEFDAEHRAALFDLTHEVQTVLTTTELEHLPSDFLDDQTRVVDLGLSANKVEELV